MSSVWVPGVLIAIGGSGMQDGAKSQDAVNHPRHYSQHPSGVECIEITEYFNFNLGNAIKYVWRAGHKGDELEDLRKALWYIDREISRRTKHDEARRANEGGSGSS